MPLAGRMLDGKNGVAILGWGVGSSLVAKGCTKATKFLHRKSSLKI